MCSWFCTGQYVATAVEHHVGASYGAYPPKIASQIKCSLPEAEAIFNAYHNELYPGITQYREEYILPTAQSNSRLHLGLGCYIYTDNAARDVRTLNNATCQFWSILTLLAINELHRRIDAAGLSSDILCVSTIYDSIYWQVTADFTIIKWLNDNLIEVMLTPYLDPQIVVNEAACDIGLDWATMVTLPHNASIDEINAALSSLKVTYG